MPQSTAVTGGAEGFAKGIAEVAINTVTGVISSAGESAKKVIEGYTKDLLSSKGVLDDSSGALIFVYYKNYNSKNHTVLMRMLGNVKIVPKPIRDDFVVVSTGVLALLQGKTPQKPKKDVPEKDGEEVKTVEQNLALLGIDYNNPATFTMLFKMYDEIVQKFVKLEEQGNANFDSVKNLIESSNLYGDETFKKRAVGLTIHIKNWPKAIKFGMGKGWGWLSRVSLTVFTALDDALEDIDVDSAELEFKRNLKKFQSI